MRVVVATQGQTIYDIAIQEYGCYEGVFQIMKDNEGFGLSTELVAGQSVNIQDTVPELTVDNQAIAQQFKVNNTRINSSYGYSATPVTPAPDGPYDPELYNPEFYET